MEKKQRLFQITTYYFTGFLSNWSRVLRAKFPTKKQTNILIFIFKGMIDCVLTFIFKIPTSRFHVYSFIKKKKIIFVAEFLSYNCYIQNATSSYKTIFLNGGPLRQLFLHHECLRWCSKQRLGCFSNMNFLAISPTWYWCNTICT